MSLTRNENQRKEIMDKEHTIDNGASRMEECAEHIRESFSEQGYSVDVVNSQDTECKGLFVQVSNIKGSIGGILKVVSGLNVSTILCLRTDGDDLKFRVDRSKWVSPAVLAAASILPSPLDAPGLFLNPLFLIGCRNQKRLMEKVFMETMSFLTLKK